VKHIQHSVRLSPALNRTLAALAEQRGMTSYQMLKRAIEQGFAVMTNAKSAGSSMSDVGDEMATMSARLAFVEALADRGLFTASAAYTYARRAALRGDNDPDKTDAAIGEAAQAAYKRQRALAAERL
jgi:predicted transcriptional regulator